MADCSTRVSLQERQLIRVVGVNAPADHGTSLFAAASFRFAGLTSAESGRRNDSSVTGAAGSFSVAFAATFVGSRRRAVSPSCLKDKVSKSGDKYNDVFSLRLDFKDAKTVTC